MAKLWFDVLIVLWLSLPLIAANMLAVVFGRIQYPIHSGLFGPSKTWLGLIGGSIAAVLATKLAVIIAFYGFHSRYLVLVWGWSTSVREWHISALAVGALLGDLAKSLVKRRFGIAPGKAWWPFDQLDAVVGGFGLCWLVDLAICNGNWFRTTLIPGRSMAIAMLIPVYLILHGAFSLAAHRNGLKSQPH